MSKLYLDEVEVWKWVENHLDTMEEAVESEEKQELITEIQEKVEQLKNM